MRLRDGWDLGLRMQQRYILWNAQMDLTNRCNEKCIHCLRDTDCTRELSFEEIKDILIQLKEEGCIKLTFSGGEIFLRKDIWDILRLARKMEFGFDIKTNGLMVRRGDIKRLKAIRPLSVHFSVYGASPGVHESITQTSGSFEKTMEAIRLCRDSGIAVVVAAVVFNNNFHELAAIKKMAKKEGCDVISEFIITPRVSGDCDPIRLRLTREQLKLAFKQRLLKWGVSDRDKKYLTGGHALKGGKGFIHISASGKVYPSLTLRMELGDLRRQSVREIWCNSSRLNWLRSLTEKDFGCYDCTDKTVCPCQRPDLAFLEHGDLRMRPLEACRINKIYSDYCREKEQAHAQSRQG